MKITKLTKEENKWYTYYVEGSKFPCYLNFNGVLTLEELNNSLEKLEKEGIYDFNSLLLENASFHNEYGLLEEDVKKVNNFIELIKKEELIGQTVHIITPKGKEYNAIIDVVSDDGGSVRVGMEASAHTFVKNNSKVGLSYSGGYWQWVNIEDLTETKETHLRRFWTWGNRKACANGGIYFLVKTKKYKLSEKACADFY